MFSKKQKYFFQKSKTRINIADGAVRSGKTFIFNYRWVAYMVNGPPGDLLMVGKTIRTLERNVLFAEKGLFDLLGKGNYTYNRSTGELKTLGRRIYCVGASDEKSEGKIRGMTLAGALCDEVTLYPKSFITQLLARCSVAGSQQFWNCNPDSPYHYIKTDYIDNKKLRDIVTLISFSMDDNPILDEQYKEDLKQLYQGVWYKRFILGLWVPADGAVYDMWDEDIHVIPNSTITALPESFDKTYVGIDYATGNPTAFILVGVSGQNVYVIDEYYWDSKVKGRQKLDSEYSKDLQEFIKGREPNGIIIDPSAASFILQLQRDGVKGIQDADNDVLDGIRNVGTLLTAKRLFVHRRCENLRKEFSSYIWDEKAQLKGEDKPIKQNDHALDALRYVVRTKLKYLCAGPAKQYKAPERKYSPTTGYM